MPVQGRRLGHYVSNGVEYETFTCGHDQEVTVVPHGGRLEDVGTFCHICQRPICKACGAKMMKTLKCDPFEEKLHREETRLRLVEAVARAA